MVVRLKREKGSIALELRDNGRGISEADMAKPKSFGLRGIRERVHSLAGEFSISAGEHGGTHIRLRVPEKRGVETPPAEEAKASSRNCFELQIHSPQRAQRTQRKEMSAAMVDPETIGFRVFSALSAFSAVKSI